MMYTYSDELISDLHKDAHGFRPNNIFMYRWDSWTPDQKQECWDVLAAKVDRDIEADKAEKAKTVEKFWSEVEEIGLYAWVERLMLTKYDLMYGGEFVCYMTNLPYSMADILDPVCKSLLAQIERYDDRADEAEYYAQF